nr:uncharacterized protein LOC115263574 [Aedes albopictus]
MFKILSEAAKGISLKNLEVLGKLAKARPSSSSSAGKDHGLTDFSKKKACKERVCRERPPQEKEPKPRCENPQRSSKTWRSCPDPPKQKKFTCDDVQPPRAARRSKLQVATKTPCVEPPPTLQAPDCFKVKTQLCPRASMPGCGKAKIPPRCDPKRVVRDCIRAKPPFPSFSECYKFPFSPPLRSECTCLTAKKICL